jgi:phage FluMu gp28-like protein
MAKKSTAAKEAMEELRSNLDTGTTAGMSDAVRVAYEAAKNDPIWTMEIQQLEELVTHHTLGTFIHGWSNPYVKTDPRSLLLGHQFLPFHDPSRYVLQLQGRQSGKDFTLQGHAVTDCFSRKTEWMIGAPSERQGLDSMDQGKLWARAYDLQIADYDEQRMGRDSSTLLKSAEITFQNGSRLRVVPGRPDTVRGRSANVGLTEADFFEQPLETWRAILPSITNPLRGGLKKARIVSTPNGKGGLCWKIIDKPAGKKMSWSVHRITILHAVLMGLPVDVQEIREAMDDPEGFAQEYLVEFLDGSNVLLPYDIIQLAESFEATESWDNVAAPGGQVFCGIDFGRSNDPTVCWTVESIGGILWTREVLVLRDMPTDQQEEVLRPRIRRANKVCLDYTGPGIGLGDYLVREHGQWAPEGHVFGKVELCTFTSKLKREMFPRLRRAFEAPTKLRIPSSTAIREDLHEMRQTITNGEYNYWSPRTKDGHSDRCTALALCVRAAGDANAFYFPPRPGGRRTRNKERSVW